MFWRCDENPFPQNTYYISVLPFKPIFPQVIRTWNLEIDKKQSVSGLQNRDE